MAEKLKDCASAAAAMELTARETRERLEADRVRMAQMLKEAA